MKTFVYRGFERGGARARGMVEALDLKDAREKLSRGGIFAEELDAAADGAPTGSRSGGRNPLDAWARRAEFYRALAALLKAGLPVAGAFEILLQQPVGGTAVRLDVLAGIRDRIRDGAGLAAAMTESRIRLSPFETAVMESGERTGRMSDVLEQVADYLDDAERIRQSLRTACVYPLLIIVTALVVCTGVMGFLVPQMAGVFRDANMELPWLTRVTVMLSGWFVPVILPLLLLAGAGTAAWLRRVRANPDSLARWEQNLSRLPVVGEGFRLGVTVRFARTCSMLLKGGLPLVDAFILSGRATGSAWLAAACARLAEEVRHGLSFGDAIGQAPVLNQSLSSWVRAGEASGNLPGFLDHAAQRTQQVWTAYLQRMTTLIEPALIIVVAVFVLLIALAILLPILSLNQQLQ